MCCQGFYKKVIPFAVTFILGIFAAGIFYYAFAPVKIKSSESFDKPTVYKKSDCRYERMRMHREIEEEVIFLDVPPVAPEPPLMAPDVEADFEAYPPPPSKPSIELKRVGK
jgi:hypothetical protein